MSDLITRPSFVLCDDTRFHRGAGYLFCSVAVVMAVWKFEVFILWGGLMLAGFTSLWRAKRNRVIVEIGPNGIWRGSEYITDWNGFVRARITTEVVRQYKSDTKVYPMLEIDHFHEPGGVFRRRLNLSDAPGFSKEAMMEAIAHFHGNADVSIVEGRVRTIWLDIDGDPVYEVGPGAAHW